MLEIFYGTDQVAARAELQRKVEELRKGDPSLAVGRIDGENYERRQLESLLGTTSLFGEGALYVLDTPSLTPELYEEVTYLAAELAASPYYFLVIEKTLLAAEKKKFPTNTTLTEFKKASLKDFDAFSLATALTQKDKRSLWLTIEAAKKEGMSAEEIIGIFWWQLKTLKLALVTTTAAEAGVKDYPYNKAKQALRLFKEGEIDRLIFSLLELYHDGHAGKRDIDLALEAWVLRG